LAEKGFKEYSALLRSDPTVPTKNIGACSYERRFKVLSVVGPLLSFEDYEFSTCEREAHPEADTRYTAVDLLRSGDATYAPGGLNVDIGKPSRFAKLTDFFPEEEILSALLADSLIKKALQYKKSRWPSTVGELIEDFRDEELSIQTGNGCSYEIAQDLLTRFAFHHLEGDKVAIRLGLAPEVGACRTTHAELGILLSIPESLDNSLRLAARGTQGFLTKDAPRLSDKRLTIFNFRTTDRIKHSR
jgi:hypothetical protein